MPNEGLDPEPEQEPQEDFTSWESPPSGEEFSDPMGELYALIEQDLWMGHARRPD
jgi:hypothetical protein